MSGTPRAGSPRGTAGVWPCPPGGAGTALAGERPPRSLCSTRTVEHIYYTRCRSSNQAWERPPRSRDSQARATGDAPGQPATLQASDAPGQPATRQAAGDRPVAGRATAATGQSPAPADGNPRSSKKERATVQVLHGAAHPFLAATGAAAASPLSASFWLAGRPRCARRVRGDVRRDRPASRVLPARRLADVHRRAVLLGQHRHERAPIARTGAAHPRSGRRAAIAYSKMSSGRNAEIKTLG